MKAIQTVIDRVGEHGLSNADLVSIGFKEADRFTVGNSLNFELGRRNFLAATCIGQGNEMIFLCEKSKIGTHYTDLVCIHNRDHDGFITIEKLNSLIRWFKGEGYLASVNAEKGTPQVILDAEVRGDDDQHFLG